MEKYIIIERKTNTILGRVKCTTVKFNNNIVEFYLKEIKIAEFAKSEINLAKSFL